MAGLKTLTLLVALSYFTTCSKSFGLLRQLEEKDNQMRESEEDTSLEMGLDLRKLLEEAVKKIDEVDILRVLKKSLYLRLRLCFFLPPRLPGTRSPTPMEKTLHSDDLGLPLNSDANEDDLTPEQRLEVRVILQDALNKIDDEEILRALKSSLLLRLKLCLRSSIRPSGSPRPYPTTFTKRPSKKPGKPSPGKPSPGKPSPGKPSPGKPTAAKPSKENTTAKPSPGSAGKPNSSNPSPKMPSTAKPQGPNPDQNAQRRDVPKLQNLFQMDPVEPVEDPVDPVEQLAELIDSEKPDVSEWRTELDTTQDSTETVNGLNMPGDELEPNEFEQDDLERQINDALMMTNIDAAEYDSLMDDFNALNDDLNINDNGVHERVSDAVDLEPILTDEQPFL